MPGYSINRQWFTLFPMMASGKTVGFHFMGWVLFFSLVTAFVYSSPELGGLSKVLSPSFLLFIFLYVTLFYFNTGLLLPQLYFTKKYVLYFSAVVLLFVLIGWIKPFDNLVMLHSGQPSLPGRQPPPDPPFNDPGPPAETNRSHPDIISMVLFLAVWSASSVLQIFQQWRTTERRALQAEADKAAAELSFLKAQVNPHFLFNTLNNIYSLAITKSDHTPEAILKLSTILRYITDDVKNDFVALQSEIDCVRNYIELQELRLSKKVTVAFSVTGELDDKKIAPLLFLTFIENAFKYGISNHADCLITIAITVKQKTVNFFCQNKVLRTAIEEREGVGISNAKKRLAFLYPQQYLLDIDNSNGIFTVDLTITT